MTTSCFPAPGPERRAAELVLFAHISLYLLGVSEFLVIFIFNFQLHWNCAGEIKRQDGSAVTTADASPSSLRSSVAVHDCQARNVKPRNPTHRINRSIGCFVQGHACEHTAQGYYPRLRRSSQPIGYPKAFSHSARPRWSHEYYHSRTSHIEQAGKGGDKLFSCCTYINGVRYDDENC